MGNIKHSGFIQRLILPGLLMLAALLVAGCDNADILGPEGMNERYEALLVATEPPVAANFVPNGVEERTALGNTENYFRDMKIASIETDTALVYAPNGALYDNFGIIEGADAIRDYFKHSLTSADALRVEFLQTSRSGVDYYVRWRMTIVAPALNDGEPMVSYGVSQFRFDNQGRILLHRDFWDAGTGFYEFLPGVKRLLRTIRAKLIDH